MAVRREWYAPSLRHLDPPKAHGTDASTRSDLSVDERKEYIRAVLCLQSKPAKAPKDKVPGARSRFDDFVATHMTMAGMLHSPINLFAAHRYFIYIYEKALREECGYQGYQPVSPFCLSQPRSVR
jgi:hypothetical protein